MKKTVGFRFATGTLEKLDALSAGSTRTAVLERLIEAESEIPASTVIVAPDPEIAERLVQVAKQKKVQDISSTKQVLRRKVNPMTGKSYGPVPK